MTAEAPARRLLAAFDTIRVINLPDRADRRAEIDAELAKAGLALGEAPVRLFAAERFSDKGDFPSIGAKGCFSSHLSILEEAGASGTPSLLILEDDADFAPGFEAAADAVARGLSERDWDLFYLGGTFDGAAVTEVADNLGRMDPEVRVAGSHAIALRGEAIAEAASYLRAMSERPAGSAEGGPMHVDGAYGWYRRTHPARVTLAAQPQLMVQRPSASDIDRGDWKDRLPGIGLARRAKARLTRR